MYGWDKKRVKGLQHIPLYIYIYITSFVFHAECERAFRHFDKDGDGTIDGTEVIEVMRCTGQNPTLQMVDQMMAEADESGVCETSLAWRNVAS